MKRLAILTTLFMTLIAGQLLAQEDCNNNRDDDGDGLIDCRDVIDCPNKVCEIPNDGIDNDGDRFIDCYDKETIADALCEGFFLGRSDSCSVPPVTFPPFEMKLKYKSPPNHANHITRLIAGDVDNDNVPELVSLYAGVSMSGNTVTSINTNKISIFQAPATGSSLGVTSLDVPIDAANPLIGVAFEDVAMADIDKDGCAEIFVLQKNLNTNGSYRMNAYHCDGSPVWSSHISFSFYPGMIGLADFDGDGLVELYARTQIYDAHTGTFLGSNNIDNNNTGIHFNVNKGWGMNSNAPIAVNMDNVPGLELVAGCRIYNVAINRGAMTATITLTKELANYATRTGRDQSNSTSVADFNQDGNLDVLAVGSDGAYDDNTTIFFWDQSNPTPNTYKKYTDLSGSGNYNKGWHKGAGRVNIADIDGDTLMNAVYVSGKFLYALKETATKLDTLWRRPVTEETSGITGCTMFDFNADGKSEIVYRDEDYIYIYTTENNSGTITVTRSTPMRCSSRTYNEYPIVVDMDGDGSTEICVTCSTTNTTRGANLKIWDEAEVRVYESANVPWVPARKVWNQHGYFVANVNDDLTIPTNQQLHHLVYAEDASCRNGGKSRPLNSFLNQSPFLDAYGCPSYATPDLTFVDNASDSIDVNEPTCPDNNFSISFKFWNQGDLGVSGTLPISYYNGNPTLPNATKLGTFQFPLGNLLPGDTATVTNLPIVGPGSEFTLYVVLNDDGTQVPTPINLAILGQRSGIQECNYDNMLSVRVTPRPATLFTKAIDNFKCSPTTPDNGAAIAYVNRGGVNDSTSFKFYWFDGQKPIGQLNTANDSTHVYANRPTGWYTVYAEHIVKGCGSDTVEVFIDEETAPQHVVTITEVHPYDNCTYPNGALKATVDIDGDGIPEPSSNYTYEWFDGSSNSLGVIADSIGGLKDGLGFTVIVTDVSTGCAATESKDITDNTSTFVTDTTHVDITCSNLNAGSVTATVDGNTTGYTFRWYNGSFPKPTPDFIGSDYTNRPAGFYTVVTEHDASNCFADSVIVEVKQTPGVTVDVTSKTDQTSCDVGQPNGSAVASVGGNTTDYSFEWFTGQNTTTSRGVTTNFINALPMGIYTVKAVDPLTGCFDTDTVHILHKVVIPTLTAVGSPMRKCEPLDGEVTATPNVGNLADYTFTWYNGPFVNVGTPLADTDNVLSGLKPGIYSVRAINNVTHCEASQDSALVRNLTPTINITVIPNPAKYPTDCNTNDGEISATISSTGNTAGFTVDWFTNVRPTLGPNVKPTATFATNPVIDEVTGVSSGFYTIKVVNQDDNCQAFKEYFLPSKTTDSISIQGFDLTQCTPLNGAVRATLIPNPNNPVLSTKDDFTIQLFKLPNAGVEDQIAGTTNADLIFDFSNLDSGRYYVRGIPAGGSNVCPVAAGMVELELDLVYPTLALDSTASTNCVGGTPTGAITALATGPATLNYEFFRGINNVSSDLIQNSTANNLIGQLSGFYTTRVTAGNGCFNIKSIFVPADTAILIAEAIGSPRLRCDLDDGFVDVTNIIELRSTGSASAPYNPATYNINWATTDSNPATEDILESLDSGTYSFQVVNVSTGCKSDSVEVRVDDNRFYPTINLINFTIPSTCLKPADIRGMLQASSGGDGITTYSYNWFEGEGITGPLVIADSIAQNLDAGLYTILSRNNINFCERIDTVELPLDTAHLVLRVSAAPLTFCSSDNGEVFAIIATPNPADYSYDWYYKGTTIGTPDFTGNSVTGLTDTTLYIIATDLNPALSHCTIRDSIRVLNKQVIPLVTAQALAPNMICDNSNPDGIVAASVDGDVLHYTFDWYEDPIVNPSFASGAQIGNLLHGNYRVIATHIVTGCAEDTTAVINFAPLPLPPPNIEILSHVTSCVENNGIVAASVNGITQGYTFKWYNGEFRTTPALPALHNAVGEVYDSLDVGFYSVTATDNYTQCVTDPAVAELIFDPLIPEFELASEPATCEGGDGRIFMTVTNDIEIDSIVWEHIGSGVVSVDDPVLEDVPYGDYRVTVITQLGCTFSKDIRVLTDIRPFNGISRNGDGKNDYFHINCIDKFEDNIVRIYNRAGTLVYEEEKYDNIDIFFDGRANKGIKVMGDNLPDGTYFFIIDKRDGSKPVAGYLEIVN